MRTYFILNIMLLSLLLGCTLRTHCQVPKHIQDAQSGNKTLIVYLSRTNNTKAVARFIQQQTSGTLLQLEPLKPYPENYQATVSQVSDENASGYLPPLKNKVRDISRYDTIFIGFPTWGMQLPPPIKSFINTCNLSGKIIIPFNTNAGYGVGNSFSTLKALCSKSRVLEGFTTKGGIERDGQLFVMSGQRATAVEQRIKEWLACLHDNTSKSGK